MLSFVDCFALYDVQHHSLMVIHLFGRKIQNGFPKGNKASPKEKIFQKLQETNRATLRVRAQCQKAYTQ